MRHRLGIRGTALPDFLLTPRRRHTIANVKALRAPVLELSEPPPATPQQSRSIAKRERLCAVARATFAERGYEGTSIQEIAERAGVAVGGVYIYFRSKRQLLVVLMNDLLQQLQKLQLEPPVSGNMQAELRRFLGSVLRTDRQNYGVIRAWQEAIANDSELAAMHGAIEKWTRQRIRRTFLAIRSYADARKQTNLDIFARVMDRHLWALLGRAATMSHRDFDEEVRVTSDIIYHYLVSDA